MLNRFFKNKDENIATSHVVWKEISHISQLDEILNLSNEKHVLIFKNSNRCGFSKMILKKFEKKLSSQITLKENYLLDVVKHRDISNKIEQHFKIKHESPQLLIVFNHESIKSYAHYEILNFDLNGLS